MKPMMRLRLLCKEGMNACNRGDFDNAMFQLHMALRLVEEQGRELMEAKVRNNMSLVLRLKGDLVGALKQLERAREVTLATVGRDNVLFRNIRGNMDAVRAELAQGAAQVSSPSTNRESDTSVCAWSAAVSSQPNRSAGAASNCAT